MSAENQSECQPCEFAGTLGKAVLNALKASIAILDHNGIIIETNRAWQDFADHSAGSLMDKPGHGFIGADYLDVCRRTKGVDREAALKALDGIQSVIAGDTMEYIQDYDCRWDSMQRWFTMRVLPIETVRPLKIIVSHEEITRLKLIELSLSKSKSEIENQKKNVEEANIALKVLLQQREDDRRELEQRVLINLRDLVTPQIDKLKTRLKAKDKSIIETMEHHLHEIASPMLHQLSNINIILTPQEIQVASLVKEGRTTTEIADKLGLSEATIHFHRKNLRQKVGIKNSSINLRTYLLSIS